jgi:DNA-binding SARP family transcriptional activator
MAGAARILDHRSIVLVDPMHAIARLRLARALALSGDIVNAKSAYNDLLTVWKNADTDLPVLQEARAEYASSRGTRKRKPLRSRPSSRRRGERAARRESAALDAGDH